MYYYCTPASRSEKWIHLVRMLGSRNARDLPSQGDNSELKKTNLPELLDFQVLASRSGRTLHLSRPHRVRRNPAHAAFGAASQTLARTWRDEAEYHSVRDAMSHTTRHPALRYRTARYTIPLAVGPWPLAVGRWSLAMADSKLT